MFGSSLSTTLLICARQTVQSDAAEFKTDPRYDMEDDEDDEAGEMYQIEVSTVRLDDSQLVTLRLESGNFVRFQPDTGAQCNVLPLHIYKKASKDDKLEKVNRSQASLVAYGGSKIKVMGRVSIACWSFSSDAKKEMSA